MNNIVKDVSTLTTIPEKTLNKFFKKMIYCICDSIAENLSAETPEDFVELNIGIGILYIKVLGEDIKYHFEPNELLQKNIKQVIITGQNPLTNTLTDSLIKKFTEVYKDLC